MADGRLARAWVQQVERCPDDDVPDYVRQGILAAGDEAGALLHALLTDGDVWGNRLAEHVIVLLGELRYLPALPLLTTLLWQDPMYWEEVEEALARFGDDAIEPLLAQLRERRMEAFDPLVTVAAGKGRADVRAVVADLLRETPDQVVRDLAELGDVGLVPVMLEVLEAIDAEDPDNRDTIVELVEGIEALGGDPGELAEKATTVRVASALRTASLARGRKPRGGR